MRPSLQRPLIALAACALAATTSVVGGGAANADGAHRLLMADTDAGSAPMRWNPCQEAITYVVNTRFARERGRTKAAARTRARTEIIRAMDKVADATGLPMRYAGTTTRIPTGDDWFEQQGPDDEIVIAYVDNDTSAGRSTLIGGAWGQGGQVYRYEGKTVVVGRGFALFDADKAVKMRSGFGAGDRRGNLVLHELGHVVGLDHVSDRKQLMHPQLSDTTPNGFAEGDLQGLRELGAAAGCIDGAADFWPGS